MFFRYLTNYFLHDMKLKYKFIITHILLVLFPTLLLTIFVFSQLSNIVKSNTIHSEEALVTQAGSTLEATVGQVSYALDSIVQNQFLSELFYTEDLDELKMTSDYSDNRRSFFSSISSLIDNEFITDVKIYVTDSRSDIVNEYASTGIMLPMSEAKRSHWYGIFQGTGDTSLICPTFYLSQNELNNYGDLAYIKRFNLPGEEDACAYVAIYYSEDYLTGLLKQNVSTPNSVAYVVNSRDCIVATTTSTLSGIYSLHYDNIPETIGSTTDFITTEILGTRLYMGYRVIADTDWYLVSVIPVDSVFTQEQSLMRNLTIFYLVFLLLACVLALYLSNSIVSRISSVIDKMDSARNGTPISLETPIEKDEIGQLVTTYNIMVGQIDDLLEEQTKTANELKVSEFKALQAQINPHFLYNMLDMINWLSMSGKQLEVSEAVQALSKFYKLTLSKGNITTSIEEELNHVSLYVKLQNMRYENKIYFLVDMSDEILDYEIPKLTLQPIVENAILHGIFERESKDGSIVVISWLEGSDIVFTISDNGVGIPAFKLPTILSGTGESETGSNIGIYNTHLRLQLLYGNHYGLHYESVEGKGTDVTVRIPAIRFEK